MFFLIFVVVATFTMMASSCKKAETVSPQQENSSIYTAEQVAQLLSQEENWPKAEEIFDLLSLNTKGSRPWEKKEMAGNKVLKSTENSMDIAFSQLSCDGVIILPGDTVKQTLSWSVIDHSYGYSNPILLENGTIVRYFTLPFNLVKTEFSIGWNNNPSCEEVTFTSNIQEEYMTLNFNYPSNHGTLNFQMYKPSQFVMCLPKLDFILSAELNPVGKIVEFNPCYQTTVNLDFDIQENVVAVIDLWTESIVGLEKNSQIVLTIFNEEQCSIGKCLTINIGETVPLSISIPTSFQPGEVGYYTKNFQNGIIHYGDYVGKKAELFDPNQTELPLMYQLIALVDIEPFYQSINMLQNDLYQQVDRKLGEIPEDPEQYQGNLEDLKDDLIDYTGIVVNLLENFNDKLEDFIENNKEELTSCQKENVICNGQWIIVRVNKTINKMEGIVEIYGLEMPENWLEELEQTLAQTNQILSGL